MNAPPKKYWPTTQRTNILKTQETEKNSEIKPKDEGMERLKQIARNDHENFLKFIRQG